MYLKIVIVYFLLFLIIILAKIAPFVYTFCSFFRLVFRLLCHNWNPLIAVCILFFFLDSPSGFNGGGDCAALSLGLSGHCKYVCVGQW